MLLDAPSFDETTQSIRAIRYPLTCGSGTAVVAGREPCQAGWYRWIGNQCKNLTVLDAGAGLGYGMVILRECGAAHVAGFDVEPSLGTLDAEIRIGDAPLQCYDEKSFHVVTCLDVIEHVVEDMKLFNELRRISTQRLYVTTPNFDRSEAKNLHHCREYTIAQFCNAFKPDRIYVASP